MERNTFRVLVVVVELEMRNKSPRPSEEKSDKLYRLDDLPRDPIISVIRGVSPGIFPGKFACTNTNFRTAVGRLLRSRLTYIFHTVSGKLKIVRVNPI